MSGCAVTSIFCTFSHLICQQSKIIGKRKPVDSLVAPASPLSHGVPVDAHISPGESLWEEPLQLCTHAMPSPGFSATTEHGPSVSKGGSASLGNAKAVSHTKPSCSIPHPSLQSPAHSSDITSLFSSGVGILGASSALGRCLHTGSIDH